MRIPTTIALAAMLSGCYSIANRDITDSDITATVVNGETAKDKVSELLGKPTWVCFENGDRVEWHYCYTITTLSFRQLIPVLGLFAGPDTELHTFTLRFDENGVVRAVPAGEARRKDGLQGAGHAKWKPRRRRRSGNDRLSYDSNGRVDSQSGRRGIR